MQELNNNQQQSTGIADSVAITYYTDPLCCWSWAFEPQWRKLQFEFEGKISWQYVMGGLLPGWENYNDPVNYVTRPVQMGPVWMHASQLSGMPMHKTIWVTNPPASSYPACIAVKCAGLQSAKGGEMYLRLLREACMLHGKNIAKQDVLLEVAIEIKKHYTGFNLAKFQKDLTNHTGMEAFKKDLQQVQYHNINRYPTLIIKGAQQAVLITGYRPYNVLLNALKQVSPQLQIVRHAEDEQQYAQHWLSITPREIEEGVAKLH